MPELTDREFAVTLDSLMQTRDIIRDKGFPTPDIDSALDKLMDGVIPSTYGIRFELIQCTSDDPNNHQGDTCPVHEAE